MISSLDRSRCKLKRKYRDTLNQLSPWSVVSGMTVTRKRGNRCLFTRHLSIDRRFPLPPFFPRGKRCTRSRMVRRSRRCRRSDWRIDARVCLLVGTSTGSWTKRLAPSVFQCKGNRVSWPFLFSLLLAALRARSWYRSKEKQQRKEEEEETWKRFEFFELALPGLLHYAQLFFFWKSSTISPFSFLRSSEHSSS